ncbi:hypothetical protein [Senimuribacter intestinalis]|uniref:hypothetical protein n=1 Tax=Senimuribacter intestinalis TaxID=2941507 RepID=UPI002041F4DE|nr:hypothetical protein [Senimuribacter intestinalis]
MKKQDENLTKIWKRYQKCKDYLDKKSLIKKTNENWNFYIGNQWEGMESGGEKLPVLNFIEPVIKYKVGVVSQNMMTAVYSDLNSNKDTQKICEILNKMFVESWDKGKMNACAWEVIEAAAVQGDAYAFWGECDSKVPPQVLANTTVLLADENITDIQTQPYVLIVERLNVESVRKIAKENDISKEKLELIRSDDNKDVQIVNQDEVTDKITSILCMSKNAEGYVEIARSTKNVVYEPAHVVRGTNDAGEYTGTGLRSYPIVPFIWKKRPNSARGVSEVAQLIPNQLEVNKTIARRSVTVKLTAYPRIAYDRNAVTNPEDLDKTGAPIEVNGGAQSVNQMVSYLNATNISSDADKLLSDLLTMSRELAGAGDYATGNVNPEQASGQAILAVRDQAQIPLNKQISQYQQFVEDVALLFFDIWVAFNPNGLNYEGLLEDSADPMLQNMPDIIPIEQVESIRPSVRVDVSQDNAWSKLAEQQWLDNVFERQQITFEEYVELCNSNAVPKAKLQAVLKKRQAMQQEQQMMQQMQEQTPQEEVPQGEMLIG